jgi:hypothetical protein
MDGEVRATCNKVTLSINTPNETIARITLFDEINTEKYTSFYISGSHNTTASTTTYFAEVSLETECIVYFKDINLAVAEVH